MKLKSYFAAAALGLAAASASATPLDSLAGNVTIKMSGQTTDNTVTGTFAGTDETTWGVGAVTQITGPGGQVWNMGSSDGTYLYFMIYGIADHQIVDHGDGTYDIYNWGASGGAADGLIHIDWYRSTTNLLSLTSDMNANPGDRTGFGSYSLFAGMGPAYLQTVLAPGKSSFDPLATLVQNAKATNNPTDGTGSFFADVVGGTAKPQWDLNGQTNGHDFNGNYTLSPNGDSAGTGVCTDAQIAAGVCFNGFINDPIKARKIPEPGSLALLGLGFAGLAGLRRRRRA